MAVELAKIALWIESVEPGKPLTFLDSHFVCGNSVLGVMDLKVLSAGIPAAAYDALDGDDKELCKALKKANATAIKKRKENTTLFNQRLAQQLNLLEPGSEGADIASRFATIDAMPERSMAEVRAKESAYFELLFHAKTGPESEAANLYLAAFLLPKHAGRPVPTSADVFGALGFPGFAPPSEELHLAARDVCAVARTLHWPIIFPAVFARGGFDCALANPPWDRIKLQEQEFFSVRAPDIANAANAAARKRMIAALAESDHPLDRALYADFVEARRFAEATSAFVHVAPPKKPTEQSQARFPLSGVGDTNLYALFAELFMQVLRPEGRSGVIVPSGICTDNSTQSLFREMVKTHRLESLYDFENRKPIFPSVDSRFKFCLLSLGHADSADFAFFLHDIPQLADKRRHFTLSAEDFALINPNTLTCPIFRSQYDAELTKKLYRRTGILWRDDDGGAGAEPPSVCNPWGIRFWTMFHMANDSGLFRTEPGEDRLPLYEAKMIGQFDHRSSAFDEPGKDAFHECTEAEKVSPDYEPAPRYWIDKAEVLSAFISFAPGESVPKYLMGWRDVTNATNFRTTIANVFPFSAVNHKLPLFFTKQEISLTACLLGDFNSLVHDWVTRQKLGGLDLTYGYMKQIATLPPSAYTQADIDYIVPRVLELTYTSHSLKPWAEDLGFAGEPFRWDEDRRALLRAELDARYARLYGLTRDELRYILDPADLLGPDYPSETFRVLKEKELATFHEYRTQRLVLAAWDAEERNRT
jgi:hypothetical protein